MNNNVWGETGTVPQDIQRKVKTSFLWKLPQHKTWILLLKVKCELYELESLWISFWCLGFTALCCFVTVSTGRSKRGSIFFAALWLNHAQNSVWMHKCRRELQELSPRRFNFPSAWCPGDGFENQSRWLGLKKERILYIYMVIHTGQARCLTMYDVVIPGKMWHQSWWISTVTECRMGNNSDRVCAH